MGWFDEQIRQRKQNDRDVLSDSFFNMAKAVSGSKFCAAFSQNRQTVKSAMDEILKFYHVKTFDIPENIDDFNEQIEYLTRPHGIMRRTVNLSDGWYNDAIGAMLAVRKDDGNAVALIPENFRGYSYVDFETGRRVKINKKIRICLKQRQLLFTGRSH